MARLPLSMVTAFWMKTCWGPSHRSLSGLPSFRGRLLFVRRLTKDGTSYKFSSRKCLDCKFQLNLGMMTRQCSNAVDGTGGGHSVVAGCSIPSSGLEDFIACIKAGITNDSKFTLETS